MFAVIGRVKIQPGQEEATLAMIAESGVAMVQGMAGSEGGIGRGRWQTTERSSIRSGFSIRRRTYGLLRPRLRDSVTCRTHPRRSSALTFAGGGHGRISHC
jgi:hypothetical protein